MDQVSLCLIVKDEEQFLPEWIDYHILLGVERFYIYDNESLINPENLLADHIKRGWVVLHKIAGKAVQLQAYKHCLDHYGKQTHWMGFIDADEFIVLKTKKTIQSFLDEYQDFAGLAISSVFFGKNGHENRPRGGQILNYLVRTENQFPENKLVKCIVKPEAISFPDSPHGFAYKNGFYCVNENRQRVDYQRFPFSNQLIQINHYFCRSEEDIQGKLARKSGGAGRDYSLSRFEMVDHNSCVEDLDIFYSIKNLLPADLETVTVNKKSLEKIYKTFQQSVENKKANGFVAAEVVVERKSPDFEEYLRLKESLNSASAQNDFVLCRELTLHLINLFPEDVIHYTSFASYSLQLGDFENAWKALSKAWQIHKGDYEVLRVMADFFYLTENFPMAENGFRSLLEIGPQEVSTLTRLGLVLVHQGRFDEAYSQLVKVLGNKFFKEEVNEEMVEDLLNSLLIHFKKYAEKQKIKQLSDYSSKLFQSS